MARPRQQVKRHHIITCKIAVLVTPDRERHGPVPQQLRPLGAECSPVGGTAPLARSPDTGCVTVYGAGATICTESQMEAVASN
jgi:hypothetical protein